ncbi:hypothetical protein Bca52824_054030 [Brassica carinata]|uniref:Uncharacterized protein n=1 Tax=Brassica carinata TaxID=52824 RepID=A0A8X7UK49_BRACI|nr:hypothetical protein Bca52824_054030 [Brassica carinata]
MGTLPDLSAIIAAQLRLTSGEGPSMTIPRAGEVFLPCRRGKGKKRKRGDGSGVERSTDETREERETSLNAAHSGGSKEDSEGSPLLIRRGNEEDDDERRSPVLTSPRERTPVPIGGGAVQTGTSSRGAAILRRAPRFSFPDKVDFHYEGPAPLVYVPKKCGEFLCQLRGRAKPLPAVKDLIFGSEYEEAARAKLLGDSTMNVVIDKYDTALKGALDELELAKKEFAEKEEVSARQLNESRDNLQKLNGMMTRTSSASLNRRRDSRILEVTRERGRVEAEMTAKANRCFAKIRSRVERRGPYDEARKYEQEAEKLKVGEIPEGDLRLSPFLLESQFVDARILAGLDPYGSNAGLIDPETAVNLHVSRTHPIGERREDPTLPIENPSTVLEEGVPGRGARVDGDNVPVLVLSDTSVEGRDSPLP